MPGHRGGALGPHGPNVATELEAALAADLSGGLGGRRSPSYPPMGPRAPPGALRPHGRITGGAPPPPAPPDKSAASAASSSVATLGP